MKCSLSTEGKLIPVNAQEEAEYQVLTLLYLQKKYPGTVCALLPPSGIKPEDVEREDFQVVWTCDGDGGGNLFIPVKRLLSLMVSCSPGSRNTSSGRTRTGSPQVLGRFIIVSVHLWSCPGNRRGGHANALVIDTVQRKVERIEPNGGIARGERWYSVEGADEKLTLFFKRLGYIYYSPYSLFQYNGIQRLQIREIQLKPSLGQKDDPEGFCSSWSVLIAELRVLNPEMSMFDIMNDLTTVLSSDYSSLTEYIRAYSSLILNHPVSAERRSVTGSNK